MSDYLAVDKQEFTIRGGVRLLAFVNLRTV